MYKVIRYESTEKLVEQSFDSQDDARNWIERGWKAMNYPQRYRAHWIITEDGNIIAVAAGVYTFTLLSVD